MKNKKKSSSPNRLSRLQPEAPRRDWKFWCMVVITLAWGVLFAVSLFNNAQKPSMPRWWADQIQSEEKSNQDKTAPVTVKKNAFPIPYPKEGEYYKIGFNVLSDFPADAPVLNNTRRNPWFKTKRPTAQIPPVIQELDGEKISVAGFMIPMVTEKDQVSSFILAQSRGGCCYGLVPKLNQWIYVEMKGKTVDSTMDIPITVFGTLAVANDLSTQDKNWCLYRMTGDKVDLPRHSWF